MKVIKRINAKGKTAYSSDILPNIVLCAMDGIEGVVYNRLSDAKKEAARVKRMISIDASGDFIYVDVYVKVRYNVNVTDVACKIQESIKNAFNTTEFKVKDINVHIVDVELAG